MSKRVVKCAKCRQEILQVNPSKCPYCGSAQFVSEEESQEVEETGLKTAKVQSVGLLCPHCGQKQSLSARLSELKCPKCGQKYKVPEKAMDLL